LRVDRAVPGIELVALFEMQIGVLVRQPLRLIAMRTRKLACER
jgi:hypothetical protein